MSKNLLLADDSITIQKVVELILADENFEIKSVGNGEEAWSIIKNYIPDIVLADIEMPKIDGYQLCKNIKEDEKTKHIPVILLSGAYEPIDEGLLKKVQADTHIVKPFESQELIGKINSLLTEKETIEEATEKEVELKVTEIEEGSKTTEEIVGFEEEIESGNITEEGKAIEDVVEEKVASIEEPLIAAKIDITEGTHPAEGTSVLPISIGEIPLPQQEEIAEMVREILDNKVSALINSMDKDILYKNITETIGKRLEEGFSSLDLQNLIADKIQISIGSEIEKTLNEAIPKLLEETIRTTIEDIIGSSLKERIEKVIWKTVPDLTETIITREIERIKSTFLNLLSDKNKPGL